MRLPRTCVIGLLLVARTGAAALAAISGVALAQRANENVLTAAEDAFGTSIGRETIGLYTSSSVRGFSPIAAGNARIDGLYFDQVWGIPARLRRATTIRVGLSTLGFPFPAPTGVVDYALRRPGDRALTSIYLEGSSYGSALLEAETELPLAPQRLSLGASLILSRDESYDGTDNLGHIGSITARWRPDDAVEIVPFWVRSDIYGDETGPLYVPGGPYRPPRIPRRRYNGPDWVQYRGAAMNYGAVGSYRMGENWLLRAGLFRSLFDDERTFANLLVDLTPEGSGRQLIIADPPSKIASTSGELRLTRSISDGPRLHVLHASVRATDRTRRYDGSAEIDLGVRQIGDPLDIAQPVFDFTERTFDQVRQTVFGLAYEGRWRGVGELSASVQRADYRKRIEQPGLAPARTEASPLLFSVTAAAQVLPDLAVYAGYARGLEESGTAPNSAANRNEALPAIRTSQRDAGIRWRVTPQLTLIAGLFDVRKPYFNLDEDNRYALLGDVKHQGVELSLAGQVTSRLSLVAGGLLLRPRVTGEGVRLGRVGARPVGQPSRTLNFNVDWRPPIVDQLSLDLRVSHRSRVAATRDNLVELPSRTLVDVGARYRFSIDGNAATFRLTVANLFDAYAFDLRGSGAYDLTPGRLVTAGIAVDL